MGSFITRTIILGMLCIGASACAAEMATDTDLAPVNDSSEALTTYKRVRFPQPFLRRAVTRRGTTYAATDASGSICGTMIASMCSGASGKTGSLGFPGPDGGTCTLTGKMSCAAQEGCCVCTIPAPSKTEGDCKKDGSRTTVVAIEPAGI